MPFSFTPSVPVMPCILPIEKEGDTPTCTCSIFLIEFRRFKSDLRASSGTNVITSVVIRCVSGSDSVQSVAIVPCADRIAFFLIVDAFGSSWLELEIDPLSCLLIFHRPCFSFFFLLVSSYA